jgi:hypothetical protein
MSSRRKPKVTPFPIHSVQTSNPLPESISIAKMPNGSYGITEDGRVFYRTYISAVCLNEAGSSYADNAQDITEVKVQLFPRGSKIAITVN